MNLEGVMETLARLDNAQEAVENAMTEAFAYAGEYAVAGIRTGNMSQWNDQTGNLRSSVGYSVVIESGFDTVMRGSDGSEAGKLLCEQLAREYASHPYALIIVAGMDYAVYVEAIENKVVLAGGQLWLEGNIGKILQSKVCDIHCNAGRKSQHFLYGITHYPTALP